jgi:glycosyltransferase involved in cell wall biosynthesis
MNILLVAHKPPYPPVDGGTLATLNMALGLAKAGNKVTVLAMATPKHPSDESRIPIDYRALVNFRHHHVDIRTNSFQGILNLLFSSKPYNIERFKDSGFRDALRELLLATPFDIIQLEGLYLYPYIEIIRENSKAYVAFRAHNVENIIWARLAKDGRNILRAWYFRNLAKRMQKIEEEIMSRVDALVPITPNDSDWFHRHGCGKPSITVPATYFPQPELKQGGQAPANAICFLGALDWMPNTEGLDWFLARVLPILRTRIESLSVHIAGRNAPARLVKRLLHTDNVIYHGEVGNAVSYLSGYRIMIAPIISGSGIRVKVVEGMFLGKAIATTTIGCEGIAAVNGEHLLVADSPESFADAIEKLVNSDELTSHISAKARTFASENFDAIAQSIRLTEFYKALT